MNHSIWDLFLMGGAFMWPLLLLSSFSLIIIIERSIYYCCRNYKFTRELESSKETMFPSDSQNPLKRVINAYLSGVNQGEEHCLNVSAREASRQVLQHERGIKLLATIGALAPLIGLLGTVWGMVQAFAQMASMGDQVSTADFAEGIWTGLLTTVAGLIVAIPAVAAARIFESKVDRLAHDFNELASHLKERYFPS